MVAICSMCLDSKHERCPLNLWVQGMNTTAGMPMDMRITCDCAVRGHSNALTTDMEQVLRDEIYAERKRREVGSLAQ